MRLVVLFVVLVLYPATELLVAVVLLELRRRGLPADRLAEIGAGTGAVAIALAARLPDATVTATELDGEAVKAIGANAAAVLPRPGAVEIREPSGPLDVTGPLRGQGPFAAVAMNPPYLRRADELSVGVAASGVPGPVL